MLPNFFSVLRVIFESIFTHGPCNPKTQKLVHRIEKNSIGCLSMYVFLEGINFSLGQSHF